MWAGPRVAEGTETLLGRPGREPNRKLVFPTIAYRNRKEGTIVLSGAEQTVNKSNR